MAKEVAAIVAAAAESRGIGYQGQLPWKLPGDMKYFKNLTTEPPTSGQQNAVLMGRSTWESIPEKFRPLPGRINCVLSRNSDYKLPEGVYLASSLKDASEKLEQVPEVGRIFLIGGGQIYQQAVEEGLCSKVYYTEVDNLPEGTKFDTFFPELPEEDWQMNTVTHDKENGADAATDAEGWQKDSKTETRYRFLEYTRLAADNPEEEQYLNLCRDILERGIKRGDRTGTGTLSLFGTQMRFSLRDGRLPLLTTKRTFWRGVAEELLWFISGNTNANDLAAKNIHIWDGNGSKEFLESRGLGHREEGDLGPVYGFQWRHFGAKYKDMHADYSGQGVDQLAECIHKIIHNPEDRRIVMSAWNPADLDLMALPPCHMFCQFYVDTEKNEVSCQLYQRSADMGLGVPFNIASYALLTHMIAQVTGRKAGDLVHTIGDAHIYLNHVDALKEQLKRKPREFPTLKINPDKKGIDDFVYDDFEVIGYNPHKAIKMKMAV